MKSIAKKTILFTLLLILTTTLTASITTQPNPTSTQCPSNQWFSQLSNSCQPLNMIIISNTLPEQTEQQMANPPLPTISNNYTPNLGGASTQYDGIIQDCASQFNVNPNLVKAIIRVESNFNPNAISNAGAEGLMQLIPSTFNSLTTGNIFNPRTNICAGTEYLKEMLNLFGGNLQLAEAAYNAGPRAVQKYQNNIPPYPETQNYVASVTNAYNTYNA